MLKSTCPDASYAYTVSETIYFLVFAQLSTVANEMFDSYNHMCDSIMQSTIERVEATRKEKMEAEQAVIVDGLEQNQNHLFVELPIEKEVDALVCAPLPSDLSNLFSLL